MANSEPQRVDIDGYTEKLDPEIASLVIAARQRVLDLIPEAAERYKWSHPWYELEGSFCYVMAYDDHVNLGFPRGAELLDDFPMLEGTGKGMRHVKIYESDDLEEPFIEDLIQAAVDLNQGG